MSGAPTTAEICIDFGMRVWRHSTGLTLPKSQSARIPQTPTTLNLATGRGTVDGIRPAALLVTPLAIFRIAAASGEMICWGLKA